MAAHQHRIGFKHAWEGIFYSFTTQPNFRVHAIAGTSAFLLGVVLQISRTEWLILLITITLVLVAEMINTSLEAMTDLIQEKHHQHAKIAKDVSAGMVLTSVITAVIVGLAIFLPKILNVLSI